jgi:hypothetical protein
VVVVFKVMAVEILNLVILRLVMVVEDVQVIVNVMVTAAVVYVLPVLVVIVHRMILLIVLL